MRFSLPTFVKLCLLSGNKQIAEIQRKFTLTSGYDYYWTLHKAIAAHANGAQSDEIEAILLSASNPSEEANNRAAYNIYYKRFGFKKQLFHVNRPVNRTYENNSIEIQFNPTFEVIEKGVSNIYCIWAIQKPDLEQGYAAMACYLLKEAYKKTSLANSQFYFFDLVADRVYSEKQIRSSTALVATAEFKKLASIVKQVEEQ